MRFTPCIFECRCGKVNYYVEIKKLFFAKHLTNFYHCHSGRKKDLLLLAGDLALKIEVRASASQSVDLRFIPLVESYQKTLKKDIYSFPAWRSAFMGRLWRTSRQVRLLCPWARHLTGRPTFMWKTGDPDISEIATPKRVRTYRPKHSYTSLSRELRINMANKKK